MLIRFSVENFLSFNARTEFSMIAGKSRLHEHHVVKAKNRNDIALLKTGIIYGANASGKSNLVKAIAFTRKSILRGTNSENNKIDFQPFRLKTDKGPSRIEVELKHRNKSYAYGFVFDNKSIHEEWLFEINKTSDKKIFERKTGKKATYNFEGIRFADKKEEQFLEFTAIGTRKNQLFLSECRVRNVKDNVSNIDDILNVIDWFQNSLSIIFPSSKFGGLEFELRENQDIAKMFHEFLEYFNTGIKGVQLVDVEFDKVSEIPDDIKKDILSDLAEDKESTKAFITAPESNITYAISKDKKGSIRVFKMMTTHAVQNSHKLEHFEVSDESDGTQRLMDFIPAIMDLMKNDNVFIVDEIDRSLHPNLTCDFVDLFLNKSESVNSQLIVTTHESSLLNQKIVRKDEIWFVVKDSSGASSFYSLEEFKIRFDKEIRKDYLLGRYKAVPVFGNRNKLSVLKM